MSSKLSTFRRTSRGGAADASDFGSDFSFGIAGKLLADVSLFGLVSASLTPCCFDGSEMLQDGRLVTRFSGSTSSRPSDHDGGIGTSRIGPIRLILRPLLFLAFGTIICPRSLMLRAAVGAV